MEQTCGLNARRVDDANAVKALAVKTPVPSQQAIRLIPRMRTDNEVREHATRVLPAAGAPPYSARHQIALARAGVEVDSGIVKKGLKQITLAVKGRGKLSKHLLADDDFAAGQRSLDGSARTLAEITVVGEHIQ